MESTVDAAQISRQLGQRRFPPELTCLDYAIATAPTSSTQLRLRRLLELGIPRPSSVSTTRVSSGRRASNDGLSVETANAYPAGFLLDNVETVAATQRTDVLASYSNFSSGLVDIARPEMKFFLRSTPATTTYGLNSGTSIGRTARRWCLGAVEQARFPGDN